MRRIAPESRAPARFRLRGIGLGIFLLALAWPGTVPLLAQSRIEGSVRLADSIPAAAVRLELHRVTEESGALVDSTESDATGRFSFDLESSPAPGPVYLVGARYRGVLYWGAPVHGAGSDTIGEYRVPVFDTTLVREPVEDLTISLRHLVVTPAVGGMQVEEVIDVEGRPDRTLVGSGDSTAVWTATLPAGAHAVIPVRGGVPPEDVVVSNGSVGYAGPLPPTGIRIALQYVVADSELALISEAPTDRMELLVTRRPGMRLEVSGLEETPIEDDMGGAAVRRYSGGGLPAGHSLYVRATWERPGRRSAWLWLAASGGLASLAFLAYRRTSRPG